MAIFNTVYGGEPKWKPWSNTLAYYDFENDTGTTTVNKASTWSTYDWTFHSTPTYWTTAAGKKYFDCGGNNWSVISSIPINYGSVTLFMWLCRPSFQNKIAFWTYWFWASWNQIVCVDDNTKINDLCIWNVNNAFTSGKISTTGWHNVIMTNDGTNAKLYVDWTLEDTKTWSTWNVNQQFLIWNCAIWNNPSDIRSNLCFNGYFWALWFENVVWDETAAANYFTKTKANYGL